MAIGALIPMIAASASSAGRAAIIRRFRSSGATAPGSAIPFTPSSASEGRMFNAILGQGLIAEAAPGRFHLLEGELAAFHKKQVSVVRAIAGATLVALTTAFLAIR